MIAYLFASIVLTAALVSLCRVGADNDLDQQIADQISHGGGAIPSLHDTAGKS